MRAITIGKLQTTIYQLLKREGKEYVVVNVKSKTIIGAFKVLPMPTAVTEAITYKGGNQK